MKIYVAGASKEIDLIEKLIARLKKAGHQITHDWTVDVRCEGGGSPDNPNVRRNCALKDLAAVRDAQIFWLVKPAETSTSTGAWVELGAALVTKWERAARDEGRRYLIASGTSEKCIFADLVDHSFVDHVQALEHILEGDLE